MTGAQARRPERLPNYELGGVCKLLIIGSCCFPIVLRELGTRHAFTQRFDPVEAVAPPFSREYQSYFSRFGSTLRPENYPIQNDPEEGLDSNTR